MTTTIDPTLAALCDMAERQRTRFAGSAAPPAPPRQPPALPDPAEVYARRAAAAAANCAPPPPHGPRSLPDPAAVYARRARAVERAATNAEGER